MVLGGESFPALMTGLQGALNELGGAPQEHRTDSLSAAFRNVSANHGQDHTDRYAALCEAYGMKASRNHRGVAHENGAVESAHGHLKNRIRDVLTLRGSNDFENLDAYRTFIAELVGRENAKRNQAIQTERDYLIPLPASPPMPFDEAVVTVTRAGGFTRRRVFYTVPSRLIGYRLRARIFDDRIELFRGDSRLETVPRGHKGDRPHVVNYHQVIHSLKKKPMALMRLNYRDTLFPRQAYRLCFERALDRLGEKPACQLLVKLLALAHERNCETELALAIEELGQSVRLPDVQAMKTRFAPARCPLPEQNIEPGDLNQYARLLDQKAS